MGKNKILEERYKKYPCSNDEFTKILTEHVIPDIVETLSVKGNEYSSEQNTFHNFIKGSIKRDETPEENLLGLVSKQIVSVDDMVEKDIKFDKEIIDEKLGDIIKYYILLEVMMLIRKF